MGRKQTRWLPVKLTDDELIERAKACAQLRTQLGEVTRAKMIAMKDFADKLKMIEGEADKLSAAIHKGEENREVEVEEHVSGDFVHFYRADTGERVEDLTRAVTAGDKQKDLF